MTTLVNNVVIKVRICSHQGFESIGIKGFAEP